MPKQVQLRRGTTTEHSTFTGAVGEVTIDTTKDTVVVHDGVQAGGYPLARESALSNYILTSAIGTTVQGYDADLQAIGALAGTSGLLRKTAANTWSLDTSTFLTGNQTITISGDASGSGTTAITLTLATQAGLSAGTYNNVTVNTKGIVTAASNVSYLTSNQSITLSGDASGSGSTAISVTLANSGVTAGTYTKVTVDAKGRVTSATTLSSADLPTYTGTLTSSQITTGLGFTPYNATNPNGYITSSSLSTYAPLASPTFTGTVTTATADLLGPVRQNITAVAASAIDCSAGNYFTKTASGALTWTFTNVPATRAFAVILELTNGGTGTQTWPAAVKWPAGTAPTLTASGVDVLGFVTDDGGTTWRGVQLMKDSK